MSEKEKRDFDRLTIIDNERVLRDQLEDLVRLRIYGTSMSDVVRVLVAREHLEKFDGKEMVGRSARP